MTFVPLVDPEVQRVGFGPQSVYVECCLQPLIGASCCQLCRRVAPPACAVGPRSAMAHAEEHQRRRDEAVRSLTGAGISYLHVGELSEHVAEYPVAASTASNRRAVPKNPS